MIIAYDYTNVTTTYVLAYGCTVDQYVYVHFFRKNLRPKVWQMRSQMLDCVIILHDNTRPHTATSITIVFQEYGSEGLSHLLYIVQSWFESPGLWPIPKTQGTTLRDSFQRLKWAVFGPNHERFDGSTKTSSDTVFTNLESGRSTLVIFLKYTKMWWCNSY